MKHLVEFETLYTANGLQLSYRASRSGDPTAQLVEPAGVRNQVYLSNSEVKPRWMSELDSCAWAKL